MQYESQYYGIVDFSSPYLSHHGVKGQKWGVRRFQNEDGSLTEAGRSRYTKEQLKTGKRAIKGKRLYEKGYTVTETESFQRQYRKALGVTAGASAAYLYYSGYGKDLVHAIMTKQNLSTVPVQALAPAAIIAGSAAVYGVLTGIHETRKKNMRAYAHGGMKYNDAG